MAATYDELPIDESFPRDYDVEWLIDMPNSPSLKPHYLGLGARGDGSGPILRVTSSPSFHMAVAIPISRAPFRPSRLGRDPDAEGTADVTNQSSHRLAAC
jgi:hypothetical protein